MTDPVTHEASSASGIPQAYSGSDGGHGRSSPTAETIETIETTETIEREEKQNYILSKYYTSEFTSKIHFK